jgi:manganese efflux pump family protein
VFWGICRSPSEICDHVIWEVLGLGFVLSLDNFRVAVALGTVPFGLRRAVQVALTFGLWDVVMPLVGLVLGRRVGSAIGPFTDLVGSIVLGGYGLYLLVGTLWKPEPPELDHAWVLSGIPLSLSLDNLVAGAGLGLLGLSPWFSSLLFGAITVVMSFVGLQVGRFVAQLIPIRWDLVSGIALIASAILLPIAFG